MGNTTLFHGNGSFEAATVSGGYVHVIGKPGDKLGIDDVRKVSEICFTPFIGGNRYIVLGPIDRINQSSCDPLLKIIEEGSDVGIRLWAYDIDSVSDTIKSRCLCVWSPGEKKFSESVESDVSSVIGPMFDGQVGFLFRSMGSIKDWGDDHYEFLSRLVLTYLRNEKTRVKASKFWNDIRDLMKNDLTKPELINVVLRNTI